jgi:hypothetical protein
MYALRVILVLFLMAALLVACIPGGITGSGEIVTHEESFTGFDRLDISHAFDVDVRQGSDYSVIIRVDDNIEKYLEVKKQGSTLKIGMQPNLNLSFGNTTMEAEITMPELVGLNTSGASSVTITGFESSDDFDAELSGASTLRGDIEAGDVRFEISGASSLILTGSGDNLRLDISGASDADLEEFPVEDARIELSGASNATVNVNGTLDVEASGASDLYYVGEPSLGDIDTSGASSIKRK